MKKEPLWKRELKEMLIIACIFFVIFVLLLLLKKSLLNDYKVDFYVITTALVGSLILAKVILIFDMLPVTKKTDHMANIYRVFFRSIIYFLGYVIFTFLEHLIKGLIAGDTFSVAIDSTVRHLISSTAVPGYIGVFIAFLIFNAFWVIRRTIGPAAFYDMFFKSKS